VRTARRRRTLIAVNASCPEERVRELRRRGVEVHKFEVMDAATVLTRFCLMGVPQVLIEGGGEAHASALEAGIVDEVVAFVAPRILGGRDAKTPVEGRGVDRALQALQLKEPQVRALGGGEVMIRGYLR
jgi:diaminohydroxyphosphoribosylaminopyrimidine deaminase/5-amino-6-(5-phosphoribosylamino)uracil reductase